MYSVVTAHCWLEANFRSCRSCTSGFWRPFSALVETRPYSAHFVSTSYLYHKQIIMVRSLQARLPPCFQHAGSAVAPMFLVHNSEICLARLRASVLAARYDSLTSATPPVPAVNPR